MACWKETNSSYPTAKRSSCHGCNCPTDGCLKSRSRHYREWPAFPWGRMEVIECSKLDTPTSWELMGIDGDWRYELPSSVISVFARHGNLPFFKSVFSAHQGFSDTKWAAENGSYDQYNSLRNQPPGDDTNLYSGRFLFGIMEASPCHGGLDDDFHQWNWGHTGTCVFIAAQDVTNSIEIA